MGLKQFAPDYNRDEEGRVLFPRDTDLRAYLFPYTDPTEHIAKANMNMVRELVKFVSEEGETVLDPFGGTGTILVALLDRRKVLMIELEEHFQKTIESNIKGAGTVVPKADELAMLIPGDCNKILPLPPGLFRHMIFSPPYSNLLKKGENIKNDKTSVDLGYGSAALYTAHPDNIGKLSDFIYFQKMERVYKKFYDSLPVGGTMTIIIKDRMIAGKRIFLGKRAERDCNRIGFETVTWNRWFALGGGYSAINRAMGLETVTEEDLITLRRTH
mgnify:FL=1